jgi:hypothetical protein
MRVSTSVHGSGLHHHTPGGPAAGGASPHRYDAATAALLLPAARKELSTIDWWFEEAVVPVLALQLSSDAGVCRHGVCCWRWCEDRQL